MRFKTKLKKWIKNHWDETVFLLLIGIAIYFILRGSGYFG